MRRYILILFIFFIPFLSVSQEVDTVSQKNDNASPVTTNDTIRTEVDSVQLLSDSAQANVVDTTKTTRKGDIQTTVNYKAKDSVNFNLKTQDIIMYNTAHVDYGDIELDADKIKVNYESKILDAQGLADTLGTVRGKPIFTDKGQVYQTEEITYNFDTKKAIIKGVITQQGEAFMHSEWIKKNEKDELFGEHALYTTCNLEHPHFGISANKIKMIPNDKILIGPFNLEISEIPTPLLLPFGLFPMPNTKTSGILFPTYGEENRRGFFLRDGGYYWAMSEYVDMALRGEIYSKGSYGLSLASNYKKRYSYNGNLNIRFNQQRIGETEADSAIARDFWVQWSHRPESKGTGRFSASVNGGTSSFNSNNPTADYQQQVNANFTSNISYSNVIQGTPFNYAVSARHNQNVITNEIDILLPEVALNMNRQYPFKQLNVKGLNWVQKLNYSYNFTSTNRITNNIGRVGPEATEDSIAPFNMETLPYLLERANNGGRHKIPVSTSFNLLKFITASPNFSYEDIWYLKELNHRYSDSLKTVVIDTINQFSRAGSYSAGIGFTTRLYGTIYPSKGAVKAVRHIMTPSVNLSWRPDFGEEQYGIYKEVQTDSLGNTRIFSKYEGFVYGSPGRGKSGTISLSLANTIEMKVKKKNDTSDTPQKVKIFDNLSFSTSYNVIADSFRLAPININARTNLFNGKLDVNLQTTINPYLVILDSVTTEAKGAMEYHQRRVDTYAWEAGQGIGKLTNAVLSLSTNLNPKGKKSDDANRNSLEGRAREAGATEDQVQAIANNPDMYVDFSVPWNLRVRYNIRWSRIGFEEPTITQTANFSGDVNFTEKWKVGFTSGYDFEKNDFTQTSFNIFRDLHCWQINANWTPFGRFQSFSVDIGVKASILQDLKLNRRRSWFDN
ncbi:LPS-assembly protein LptD [Marivirga sp. S37H4]|uniref:LPS-assembly protein LptD n=1 Tax=Marivirga aurantiaca TaxID=2802615 RepID=A0A934WXJ1_9BACT|nr:putative LPS assembly protein LptD [Marivirga aurantiaca]MBK6264727.1 LPS-assembly protein LptD [Marivirga aurantiaca]